MVAQGSSLPGQNPAYRPSGIFLELHDAQFFCNDPCLMFRLIRQRQRLAVALIVLSLAARLLVPVGWMPGTGQSMFMLCTGQGAVAAWIDDKGELHKSTPPEQRKSGIKCVFAGLGSGLNPDIGPSLGLTPVTSATILQLSGTSSTIGQGLAAPPPPSTGPPFLI
jgi:hypothetical protein